MFSCWTMPELHYKIKMSSVISWIWQCSICMCISNIKYHLVMVVDLIGMIMTKQSHKYADKDDMHQVGWSWYIVVHHLQVAMCCLLSGCRQWYLVERLLRWNPILPWSEEIGILAKIVQVFSTYCSTVDLNLRNEDGDPHRIDVQDIKRYINKNVSSDNKSNV